jgi:hypothetical protein
MTTTITLTHIIGTSFTKLRLFFDRVFFNISTLFPPLCETLYACRLTIFAKAVEDLHAHLVSARRRRPQNGVLYLAQQCIRNAWRDPYSFEKQLNCCEVRKVGDDENFLAI